MATQIFISYSHENSAVLDAFLKALTPVARRYCATVWHDRKMTSGVALDPHIAAELDGADVFLALISQAFLTSSYILEIELPAMRAAVEARGALLIPVVVEPCSWKDDFGRILAVPLTHRGILKPIIEWTPRSKGFHEAAEQVGRALADFVAPPSSDELGPPPPIPDEEPGPKIGLVDGKFDLVTEPPPQVERAAPAQVSLHGRLRDRLDRLGSHMQRVENSHRGLCQEFDDYRRFVASDLADLDVAALLSAGNGLSAMVAVLERHDPAASGTMTDALEPEIVGGLKALLADHALFVMGFEEGRELTARLAQNRLYGEDLRDVRSRTEAVLAEFEKRPTLFGESAKSLVASSLRALREGAWDARDVVETGAGLAVNGVVGIGRELAPKLINAVTPVASVGSATWFLSALVGDPNMDAIKAGLNLFTEATRSLAALAVGQDIHRFITWIGDAAARVVSGRVQVGVNQTERGPEQPPDFDLSQVKIMVLDGVVPPKDWHPFVRELDLSHEFAFQRRVSGAPFDGELKKSTVDAMILANFQNLEKLNISWCDVINQDYFSNIKSLKYFAASMANIVNLDFLKNMSELEVLNLMGCQSEIVPDLSRLRELRSISVSGMEIKDLGFLSSNRKLKSLFLSNTQIDSIIDVSNFESLEKIFLVSTNVVDIWPLANLKKLRVVDISDTGVIDVSPLFRLPSLREFYLAGTGNVDLRALHYNSSLEVIDLQDVKMNIRWPRRWPKNLKQLNLFSSHVPRSLERSRVPFVILRNGRILSNSSDYPNPFKAWIERLRLRH